MAGPRQARPIWLTIAAALVFIALVLTAFVHSMTAPRLMSDSELKLNGAYRFQQPRRFDAIALIDQHGQPFTERQLQGKWSLVFFGYSSCPDICPTTLNLLTRFQRRLRQEGEAENSQVILVTVDPVTDTPQRLRDYLAAFDPQFIALSGEFVDLQRFATQLSIPFRKTPHHMADGSAHSMMDHGANIALINPQGHYHALFKAPLELAKLTATFRSIRRQDG